MTIFVNSNGLIGAPPMGQQLNHNNSPSCRLTHIFLDIFQSGDILDTSHNVLETFTDKEYLFAKCMLYDTTL